MAGSATSCSHKGQIYRSFRSTSVMDGKLTAGHKVGISVLSSSTFTVASFDDNKTFSFSLLFTFNYPSRCKMTTSNLLRKNLDASGPGAPNDNF